MGPWLKQAEHVGSPDEPTEKSRQVQRGSIVKAAVNLLQPSDNFHHGSALDAGDHKSQDKTTFENGKPTSDRLANRLTIGHFPCQRTPELK